MSGKLPTSFAFHFILNEIHKIKPSMNHLQLGLLDSVIEL